ncbi:recombinase family protein [Sulfurovum sp. XGS-02]|uniref:recombinase family protein n=1 Tax=Sulfurovum sp. XGS-02 TaxID=2925411 RepID=UPI00206F6DC0|nr:recombinase family protein [Sulfurovum sp. XGS-02]UPT77613.1 recombinase family protein [Sulfurovum sp. XGS-02]
MVYAYMRQVPGFPHLTTQQSDILSFSLRNELDIDKEVVEYATKNLLLDAREDFEAFLRSMQEGNTIIVSSLIILSDKVEELIKVINCMLSHSVDLWIVDSNMLMNKETDMIEIFPLLNELRQEEKEKTNQIGRPKGSKSSSKFDIYQREIISFLREGMNVSAIARELDVSRSSLKDYIESRGIRELVEGAWMEMNPSEGARDMDNIVLICPFEKDREAKKQKVS